jgi:hypothetical protein
MILPRVLDLILPVLVGARGFECGFPDVTLMVGELALLLPIFAVVRSFLPRLDVMPVAVSVLVHRHLRAVRHRDPRLWQPPLSRRSVVHLLLHAEPFHHRRLVLELLVLKLHRQSRQLRLSHHERLGLLHDPLPHLVGRLRVDVAVGRLLLDRVEALLESGEAKVFCRGKRGLGDGVLGACKARVLIGDLGRRRLLRRLRRQHHRLQALGPLLAAHVAALEVAGREPWSGGIVPPLHHRFVFGMIPR